MATAALVAVVALFIDGYTYIYRYFNHVPLNESLHTAPQLFGRDLYVHKGLDLQGGTEIVLEIDPRSLPNGVKLSDAQNSTVQVMDKRANGIGVSEAAVQAQGDRRVVVQLPGIGIDRARQVIGKTAKLTFRTWQKPDATQLGADGILHVPVDATGDPIVDPAYVPKQEGGTCTGSATIECIPMGYLPKETGVDGSMVTGATLGADVNTSAPNVSVTLNDQGTNLLGQVTTPLASATAGTPENEMAIFLDNTMINNANVQGVLNQGQFQISGGQIGSDAQYRKDLASTLNAGRLPGKVSIVETNTVGATLGFDSVRRGLEAGALGLAVVTLFMILYYRLPGVVAVLALAFYAAVSLAIYKLIPVTISLAGIAGFVLSVGMAVDANVLIFERLREELRNGRSLAAAAEAAVKRAFPAIRDSNIATLITCLVLYLHDRIPFLTGFTLAKGFALTLGIGVIVSFFSAVYVTQIILQLAIRIHRFRQPALYAVEKMA
ncbi:MAG TPA: protein translocase subunit SecD [Candidatus Dormibacteraeota bacterium]|nr:protein translocase subunit SecD [Candidatus Dormibacteraeota bacterium]